MIFKNLHQSDFVFTKPAPNPLDYKLTKKQATHDYYLAKMRRLLLIVSLCGLSPFIITFVYCSPLKYVYPLIYNCIVFLCVACTAYPFLLLFFNLAVIIYSRITKKEYLSYSEKYDRYKRDYDLWKKEYDTAFGIYKKEKQRYIFKHKNYWLNNTGREFEKKIEELFSYHNFITELTPATNDGGIDVIAHKGGHTIAIQCKCHKNPTGIKDARELYGILCDRCDEFTGGILVNPAGFTAGVYEFVKNKPIRLFDIEHILYWSQIKPK